MRIVLCVLALLAGITHARAHTSVGILDAGEPTKQRTVSSHVQGWLREHGYAVVAAPFDPEASTTFVNCFGIEDMPCTRGAFEKRSHAASVIFALVKLSP